MNKHAYAKYLKNTPCFSDNFNSTSKLYIVIHYIQRGMYLCVLCFLGKPHSPLNVGIICRERSATIQWTSSFNGGDPQMFKAMAFLAQKVVSYSEGVPDSGQDIVHRTQLQNLEPSTTYAFYIVAKNKHGNSSSEKIDCETLEGMLFKKKLVVAKVAFTLNDLILFRFLSLSVCVFNRVWYIVNRAIMFAIFF